MHPYTKRRFIYRVFIPALILFIGFVGMKLYSGAGAFFTHFVYPTIDIDYMTVNEMHKNRAVNGSLIDVADCLAESFTNEKNSYTGNTYKNTDSYYWLALVDDNTFMLVRTPRTYYDKMMYNVDYFWESRMEDSETDSESDDSTYDYYGVVPGSGSSSMGIIYPDGTREEIEPNPGYYEIEVDGILVKNDPKAVAYYNSWVKDLGFSEAGVEVSLAPYTLDMTVPYKTRIKNFWIGASFILVLIIYSALVIPGMIKKKKAARNPAYSGGYSQNSYSAQNNSYDAYETYHSSNYGSTDTYQSQSGISYGAANGYQSQNGASYGAANGYQSQNGASYGATGGYQSQNGASYGAAGGYQSQNGASYGATGGYQSQNENPYGVSYRYPTDE